MKKLLAALAIAGSALLTGGSVNAGPEEVRSISDSVRANLACESVAQAPWLQGPYVSSIAKSYPTDPTHVCPGIVPPPGQEG